MEFDEVWYPDPEMVKMREEEHLQKLGAIKSEIILVSIDELIPYVRNARTHSDTQVAQIAGSIREFG